MGAGQAEAAPDAALPMAPKCVRMARVGFTVSKALGKAVDRNRMRRRTREVVRHHLAMLQGVGVDVVINPKKSTLTAEFPQLSQEVERAFRVIRQNCEREASR